MKKKPYQCHENLPTGVRIGWPEPVYTKYKKNKSVY